jgi:hypothetical protein
MKKAHTSTTILRGAIVAYAGFRALEGSTLGAP